MSLSVRRGARFAVAASIVSAVAVVGLPPASAEPTALDGLFQLAPGSCGGGSVSGSFFRMILPAGDANGPFLSNSDSSCSDQTVTPLSPGSDGGLVSGQYQPQPAQAFDASGNAVSGSVTQPVRFYGVGFATATNPTDPQTGSGTALPRIVADGSNLGGDLSSLGVTWNNQVFNQGSPKPGGGLPGKTSGISGTIDPASGAFVIQWTSQIVGGPFNNFTGLWHLAGTYRGGTSLAAPAAAPVAPAAPAAPAPVAPGPAAPAAPAGAAVPAPAAPAPGPAQAIASPPLAAASDPAAVNDPALATKTIELPRTDREPRWVIPVLVLLGLLGVAVFFNVDRILRTRKS